MEGAGWEEAAVDFIFDGDTVFTGYDNLLEHSIVKAIFWNKKPLDSVKEGEICRIALDRTPFYAESGGQACDTGYIYSDNCTLEVVEVKKFQNIFARCV